MPDSYKPRGIPGNYSGRRPHHDPMIDDALCSPNYERPKDVVAALAYLDTRPDVARERIGVLAFSHGAQTGLNAFMDPSVMKSPYTVDYINAQNQTVPLGVPDPVQVPSDVPFPKVFACYYPGCGHFGYHGQASSIAANRYMPDRRAPVLMFHGTLDSLLGVNDPNAMPLTGNLFPIKFVESSLLQANAQMIPNPFVAHHIFDGADHSFDNHTIEPPQNWNTMAEDADEKAKRLARDETLKWFAYRLKEPAPEIAKDPMDPDQHEITWFGDTGIDYIVRASAGLQVWADDSATIPGSGGGLLHVVDSATEDIEFFRVYYSPVPAPVDAIENVGFFRSYGDFSY